MENCELSDKQEKLIKNFKAANDSHLEAPTEKHSKVNYGRFPQASTKIKGVSE